MASFNIVITGPVGPLPGHVKTNFEAFGSVLEHPLGSFHANSSRPFNHSLRIWLIF